MIKEIADRRAFDWLWQPRRFGARYVVAVSAAALARAKCSCRVAPRLKSADAPSNTALASLAGGDLEARFHAWRGCSGRRYICSVFPVDHRAADAGLPEFAEAIVIAAGQDIGGERRVVAFLQCEYGANALARQAFVAAAVKAGAQQWHVHLLTADPQKRRAAIEDIEALCQPAAPELAPV